MVSFAELRRLCSGWISHGMDSFGGHGAFRLGLVRFGWARRFCFGLVRCFMVRSGRARSDLVRQGGRGVFRWGGLAFGEAVNF